MDTPPIGISIPMEDGALDGGPQCRMSILRNANVACHCRLFSPMSHVEFKKMLCPVSLYFTPMSHVTRPNAACQIKEMLMSPCRF